MLNRGAALNSMLPQHVQQHLLRAGLSIPTLRSLSPLEEDAQRIIDRAVVRVGLERLTIVRDVLAAGLTYPLSDPLGVTEVQWERQSKTGGAQRTMLPSARGENQLPDRTPARIPVYLTTDDFSLNIRTLKMSERVGAPLDTSLVEEATRRVNEGIEDAMINGAGLQVDGYTTPGLLSGAQQNTMNYVGNEAWDNSGHTGEEILTDVLTMIDRLQADKYYGPYNLYVPTLYGTKLMQDFKANSDKSIMSRLRETVAGGRAINIEVADRLPANTTVMLQMTSNVVDIIDGQRPVVIPWTSPDGFTLYWMVMAIMIPRVKYDYGSNSGIVVGTPT